MRSNFSHWFLHKEWFIVDLSETNMRSDGGLMIVSGFVSDSLWEQAYLPDIIRTDTLYI